MWGLRGRVIHGIGRGGTELGFPTANVQLLRHDRGEANQSKKMRDLSKTEQEALLNSAEGKRVLKHLEPYINGIFYGVAAIHPEKEEGNGNTPATKVFPMVCSVGYNPHFGDISVPTVEVHVLTSEPPPIRTEKAANNTENNHVEDEDATGSKDNKSDGDGKHHLGDLYGQLMRAVVLGKVPREQKKYESLQALIDDIQSDCRYGWQQTVGSSMMNSSNTTNDDSCLFSIADQRSEGQQVQVWLDMLLQNAAEDKDSGESDDVDVDEPFFQTFLPPSSTSSTTISDTGSNSHSSKI